MDRRWIAGARVVDDQIPRASQRLTLMYQLGGGLRVGAEYNPRVGQVHPLLNWLALAETGRRPALILGTSSDRIGTPSGQSFYVTASKGLKRETGLPIAPYLGAAYGTFDDRLRGIGGLSVAFTEQWGALLQHDGVHLHYLVNFSSGPHTVSAMAVNGRDAGLSYSIAF